MAGSRSAAAATRSTVLSELAGGCGGGYQFVAVVAGPVGRRPDLEVLAERAAALSGYRVGGPLPARQMRFSRQVSPVAAAVGWIVHGSRATDVEQQQGMTAGYAVEQWCTDTNYPLQRAGHALSTAGRALSAVSRGDTGGDGRIDDFGVPAGPTGRADRAGHRRSTGAGGQFPVAPPRRSTPARCNPRSLDTAERAPDGHGVISGRASGVRAVRRAVCRPAPASVGETDAVLQRPMPGRGPTQPHPVTPAPGDISRFRNASTVP